MAIPVAVVLPQAEAVCLADDLVFISAANSLPAGVDELAIRQQVGGETVGTL